MDIASPLTNEELLALDEALDGCSDFDVDGVLGVLNAVAVAPRLVPPSQWLSLIMPQGGEDFRPEVAIEASGLLLRLYNQVVDGVRGESPKLPPQDDAEALGRFAAGYVAGAGLEPRWAKDEERWTHAMMVAYLAGRDDLIPKKFLTRFESQSDLKKELGGQLDALVLATYQSFLPLRSAGSAAAAKAAPKVGRNDACPCGSGKKFKKCCIAGRA